MTVLGSLRPSVSRQARPRRPRWESRDRTYPQGCSVLSIKEAMELPEDLGRVWLWEKGHGICLFWKSQKDWKLSGHGNSGNPPRVRVFGGTREMAWSGGPHGLQLATGPLDLEDGPSATQRPIQTGEPLRPVQVGGSQESIIREGLKDGRI